MDKGKNKKRYQTQESQSPLAYLGKTILVSKNKELGREVMILQDLSPKQLESYQESNAEINIWEGAVRSGKTYASIIRFLDFMRGGPPGDLIAIGKTNTTIRRNFIEPLYQLLGRDVKYLSHDQEMHLYRRKVVLVGANDERAEQKIRGSTYSGAYVDEITLLPESFWLLLLSRLSPVGSMLFGTTNPDGPFHWLKKNFIDPARKDLKVFKFKMDDNPSLTNEFKENLKRNFYGLWYKRFIDGEWVLAEGTVYDFFDEKLHCVDFAPTHSRYYVVGVDYGTTNPCAFSLIGYDPDNNPNLWVEDEYYWDSREKNRQKTDSEYAEDLKKFIRGRNVKAVYVDPSAASFKAELIKVGVQNVLDADNTVLDGIRFTASLLSNGTLKICKKCQNLIKEFQTYVWDKKSVIKGEDRPLKVSDHILDSVRYQCYTYWRPIYERTAEMDVDEYRRWKSEQGWR